MNFLAHLYLARGDEDLILGAMLGPVVLNLIGIRDWRARGLAIVPPVDTDGDKQRLAAVQKVANSCRHRAKAVVKSPERLLEDHKRLLSDIQSYLVEQRNRPDGESGCPRSPLRGEMGSWKQFKRAARGRESVAARRRKRPSATT